MTRQASGLEIDVSLPKGGQVFQYRLKTASSRIAIAGPSGSGKSTFLRVLAGLEPRATGMLCVGDEPWMASGAFVPPWKRGCGWVPQDALLFPHLSVRENIEAAGLLDPSDTSGIVTALEISHLLDRRPRNLSGGERQRVAIGRALASARRLLLLDEPFASLNPDLAARVGRAVLNWCDTRGLALVLVSHTDDSIGALATEIWEMADGKLAERPRLKNVNNSNNINGL